MIEIMLNALKDDVKEEVIEALGGIGNYDIFPMATIEDEDPEGNYDTFVIAELGGIEITLADLKAEVFETLGWKGE